MDSLLVLLLIGLLGLAHTQELQEETKVIYSVVSGSAHLPCNMTPPEKGLQNDGARLILWYKDSDPQPVYSFDNRQSILNNL